MLVNDPAEEGASWRRYGKVDFFSQRNVDSRQRHSDSLDDCIFDAYFVR